jgi:hypothetical protein
VLCCAGRQHTRRCLLAMALCMSHVLAAVFGVWVVGVPAMLLAAGTGSMGGASLGAWAHPRM